MINFKIILIFQIKSFSVTSLKVKFLKLWDFSGYYERTTSQRPTFQKLAFQGKLSLRYISPVMLWDDSIQVLLILTQFITFGTKSNLEGFVWSDQSKAVLASWDNLPTVAKFGQVGQEEEEKKPFWVVNIQKCKFLETQTNWVLRCENRVSSQEFQLTFERKCIIS